MNNRKLKTLLINKEFQLTFIIFSAVILTLLSLGYLFSIHLFFDKFYSLGQENGLSSNHIFFEFLTKQKSDIYTFFAVTYVTALLIFLFISFKISHKVAGPLYRLNEHLKEIEQTGVIRNIKFRDGDYFMEIQDNFNKAIKKINEK